MKLSLYLICRVSVLLKPLAMKSDGKSRTIKGMYVTIPAVTLFCMVNGSGFSEAFDDDDYLKLVATGKKADGTTSTWRAVTEGSLVPEGASMIQSDDGQSYYSNFPENVSFK